MMVTNSQYDLLLKNGHVIDPANDINDQLDVAVSDGIIVAVSPNIPTSVARKVVDVSDRYVTPGLIDIHTHAFGYAAWTFPDEYAFPNGVTTVVDAGGSGWKNFPQFRTEIIDKARVRVLALLNIVGGGMLGPIEQDISEMQPEPCSERVLEHSDVIVGVKAAHHSGPGWQSVDGGVKAAELSGTFLMVDYAVHPDRSYRELILEHMRPGDVHTHMYGQHIAQLDETKRVNDYMWEARERGVLFDLGHGAGSFWFRVAIPCMEQGFGPDTISTDVHKGSFFIPRATMPISMSKLINIGMPLVEAIKRSTVKPAEVISRPELGTLTVGSEADIAVFELQNGEFGFVDSGLARMNGRQRLETHITIRSGKVVWDVNGLSRPDWSTQGEYVRLED